MPSPHHPRGRLPWRFYVWLRLHHKHLRPTRGQRPTSSRIDAARLGLSRSTLIRLRAFVAAHPKELEVARRHGDWSPVEDILFGDHPHYRSLPTYANALVLLGLAESLAPTSRRRLERRRPRSDRRPAPSFWQRLWARIWGR